MTTFLTPKDPAGALPKDASGNPSSEVSVNEWRPYRKNVLEASWTKLGDGQPRAHIAIQNLSTTDTVILAPNDTDHSNDPTNDTCGLEIAPSQGITLHFTENVEVFARVQLGGSDLRVSVAESR